MTSQNASRDDFDRLMRQWMDADARVREPEHLLDSVLERTRVTRRIPGWLLPERWIPVELTTRLHAAPRLAPVLLLLALLLAVAAAIVIVGSQPNLPPPFGLAGNGRLAYLSNGQIYSAAPDGSDPRQLTFDRPGAASPIFSHDGTRFTYKRLTENEPTNDPTLYGDLVVTQADGRNPITIDAGRTGLSPALWSPDDSYLLYSYATGSDHEQIYVASADGSSPPVRVGDSKTWNWGPNWSPDGSKIAYISGNSVYVMNRDGSDIRKVTQGSHDENSGAAWSPDGTQLVFAAGRRQRHEIWLVGLDGRPEHAVASDPASEDNPVFSPDGSWLAFHRMSASGTSTSVVVLRPDGSDARTLPGTYGWLGPIWSPDGTKLIVGDDRQHPPKFYVLDPAGLREPMPLDLPDLAQTPSLPNLAEIPAWQRVAP
jgi:TolB protein